MRLCSHITFNYGLMIILFTLAFKVILLPISFFIHRNSIKMIKIKPALNMIQAKNIFDKEKYYDEQLKLLKQEGYNSFVGIIPLILQILLIIGLIRVIYSPLTYLLDGDAVTISALNTRTAQQLGITVDELGWAPQLSTIEQIKAASSSISFDYTPAELDIVQKIRRLDVFFLGLNLVSYPSVKHPDVMWLFPLLAALSSFLMSFFQNKMNVLQKEQGFWGRWGMAVFFMLFSLYFGFVVVAGVVLFWIVSNIFSIVQLFLLDIVYPPKRFIDYDALAQSKKELDEAKQSLPPRRNFFDRSPLRQRERADYKRFFRVPETEMQLVFYSEQSGFYKYFKGIIEYILANSNIIIHYITSDPNDSAFNMEQWNFKPYYIGETKLIYLMMKIHAKMVVMTMPDLQNYHIKRSYVRKDIEYVYLPHALGSPNMLFRPGALDHYDTILSAHIHHTEEIRLLEPLRNTKKKRILKCGYPLLDEMIHAYAADVPEYNEIPTVLIAPSWSEDNILDSCLDDALASLFQTSLRIVLRPHPQYIRMFPEKMNAIIERYHEKVGEKFEIQTDFSSNKTVYSADLLITDWSNISQEYSFSTKRPTLFINTKMKVINEDYNKIDKTPYDIIVRDIIGVSIEKSRVKEIGAIAQDMLYRKNEFEEMIAKELEQTLYNIGCSAEIGGNYIINRICPKRSNMGDETG